MWRSVDGGRGDLGVGSVGTRNKGVSSRGNGGAAGGKSGKLQVSYSTGEEDAGCEGGVGRIRSQDSVTRQSRSRAKGQSQANRT